MKLYKTNYLGEDVYCTCDNFFNRKFTLSWAEKVTIEQARQVYKKLVNNIRLSSNIGVSKDTVYFRVMLQHEKPNSFEEELGQTVDDALFIYDVAKKVGINLDFHEMICSFEREMMF